jgi:hypothetical protein
MGGGLMQLVAYGAQDVYLTGNPQITFFKVVYRRHTNFACEAIEQTFNGTPAFGGKATVPITRNGDLITKMWLKTDVKSTDTFAKVATSATATGVYVLGAAGAAKDADDATTNLTLSNPAFGEIKVTADGGTPFNTGFAVGDIIDISSDGNGTGVPAYHGKYLLTAQTATVLTANALAIDSKNTINGTTTAGTFDGSIADSAAITAAAQLQVTPYASAEAFEYVNDLGYALINSVELQIGGTKIDKHYGRWMHIWSQLTKTSEQDAFYQDCINAHHEEWGDSVTSRTLYVPLQFFCCRNDGLALPLIALQYHDVRLEFEFETAANCCVSTSNSGNLSLSNTTLLVNYIYLDSEERKRFAQASHEYLIEQLQFTGVESVTEQTTGNKVRLNFNHPVKELVWAVQNADETGKYKFTKFSDNSSHNPVTRGLLQLNGHDRFSEQDGLYFNRVQPNQHHSRQPSDGINVYSFALNPEEHQPSGTCNFSRIDNATLTVDLNSGKDSGSNMYVYGVNYNVLRIMSGMGGVAYSN